MSFDENNDYHELVNYDISDGDDDVYTFVHKHNLWGYFDSERYIDDECIPNCDMQYFELN